MEALRRWGPPAAVAGGFAWTLIWLHFLATHGPSSTDREGFALGLTWGDSLKLQVVPLTLLVVGTLGLYALRALRGRPGWSARAGLGISLLAYTLAITGTLILWSLPWGSYGPEQGGTVGTLGGIGQTLGHILLVLGLLTLGIDTWRRRVLSRWRFLPVLVAMTGLVTAPWLHMTVQGGLFGLGWMLLGSAMTRDPALRSVG
jgi:hypothetical protein